MVDKSLKIPKHMEDKNRYIYKRKQDRIGTYKKLKKNFVESYSKKLMMKNGKAGFHKLPSFYENMLDVNKTLTYQCYNQSSEKECLLCLKSLL